MPKVSRSALGIVLVVAITAALGSPLLESHVAAEPAATTTTTDGNSRIRDAARAAIELDRIRNRSERIDSELAIVRQRNTLTDGLVADLTTQLAAAAVQLEAIRARVRANAVAVYQRGASSSGSVLDIESINDVGSGTHYASAALATDQTELDRESKWVDALRSRHDEAVATQKSQQDREHELTDEHDQLVADATRDRTLLDALGMVPVMGESVLTGEQIAAWFVSTGGRSRLADGTSINDLANLYVIEGRAENVRGDLAFVQAVIETGSFNVAAVHNYSGIGVCDSCTGGYAFPAALDGVRAQIQLLRNYADPDSRAALLANPPSPGLYGPDPRKAANLYDTFFLKGKAPLWNQMGNGNWATDPTYAGKVIGIYAQMRAYALAHPGSGPSGTAAQ